MHPTRTSILLLAVLLVAARTAGAHLMGAGHGTVNIVGSSAFMVLSVPVSALHGFDDDGDGLLSATELHRHQDTLRAEIDHRFGVYDGDTLGKTQGLDLVLSPAHEAAQDRADQVVALKYALFAAPPEALRVTCDLFAANQQELTITATRSHDHDKQVESSVFTPRVTEHVYFPKPSSRKPLLFALAALAVGLIAAARAGRTPRIDGRFSGSKPVISHSP